MVLQRSCTQSYVLLRSMEILQPVVVWPTMHFSNSLVESHIDHWYLVCCSSISTIHTDMHTGFLLYCYKSHWYHPKGIHVPVLVAVQLNHHDLLQLAHTICSASLSENDVHCPKHNC